MLLNSRYLLSQMAKSMSDPKRLLVFSVFLVDSGCADLQSRWGYVYVSAIYSAFGQLTRSDHLLHNRWVDTNDFFHSLHRTDFRQLNNHTSSDCGRKRLFL